MPLSESRTAVAIRQVASEAWETADRLGITISADCDKQLARTYIDAGCLRVQDGHCSHRFLDLFAIGFSGDRPDAQGGITVKSTFSVGNTNQVNVDVYSSS